MGIASRRHALFEGDLAPTAGIRRWLREAVRLAGGLVRSFAYQLGEGASTNPALRRARWEDGRRHRAAAAGHRAGRPRIHRRAKARTYALLSVAAVLATALASFIGSASAYTSYAAELPDAHGIAELTLPEDSIVYDASGTVVLADLHREGYRHYEQKLADMGVWLPEATVAIEDSSFYEEPGVNVQAMVRAAWINLQSHAVVQGASTLTQQLVKMRLVGSEVSLDRKLREAVLALQVDAAFSKEQILEMYLNTAFYGNNAYGIAAASLSYFHKPTRDLTLGEAAMLAGIIQNPTYNNPLVNWKGARARQQDVLTAMVHNQMITVAQADAAFTEDLSEQSGHLFWDTNQVLDPGFVAFVVDELEARYGPYAPFNDGLRVTTTLDWAMTEKAQQLIQAQVGRYGWGNVHQGAMVALDPHSGAILAMVGSSDPNANGGQYNFAVWPPRNPGSSMKLYTYTAALASGRFTMVSPIPDSPVSVSEGPGLRPWTPRNYDGKLHGTCQLQACFLNSLNIPAVRVEMALPNGAADVAATARAMGAPPWQCQDPPGCQTYTDDDPLSSYRPSLTLGGWGETPLQMATGASVLASQGVLHQPTGVAAVKTVDGRLLYQLDPGATAKQVVDPKVAFLMDQIMSDDSNRAMIFGRGSNLTLPGRQVASKTGTTDDYRDGWTIGFTPAIATAFWFGNADWTPMAQNLEASVIAAPVWHSFMEWALNDDLKRPAEEWFAEPPGLTHATVAGKLQWFLPGTTPGQKTPAPQGILGSRSP